MRTGGDGKNVRLKFANADPLIDLERRLEKAGLKFEVAGTSGNDPSGDPKLFKGLYRQVADACMHAKYYLPRGDRETVTEVTDLPFTIMKLRGGKSLSDAGLAKHSLTPTVLDKLSVQSYTSGTTIKNLIASQ